MVAEFRTESVPIELITISKSRRAVHQPQVDSLARSIAENGMLNPIIITPEYRLVAGRHRIEAQRKLGYKTIDARIMDADKLHVELAEIDENMERHQLDALQFAQHLKRRKELYEAIHPEAKKGGDRKSEEIKAQNVRFDSTPSFTADTAEMAGVSQRTVQQAVHIAENIADDVQQQIAGTAIADSKSDLKALAGLPEAEQRKAVAKVKAGKAKTIRAAAPKKPKVHKATAPMPRGQDDDAGHEVPAALLDVFEARGDFHNAIRICRELAAKVQSLHDGPAGRCIAAKDAEALEKIADRLDKARPSLVNGEKWKSVGECQ